ncbi:sensor domain-containing protein [Acidisarcina polymorpha]|nr:diguanylate cyclase [Acidisarcina polymorpha]
MFKEDGSAALRSSENRFHLLVDSIEDYAIYMLDARGQVITWNRGAEINNGYSSREVLGRNFKMFFVPEDVQAHVPALELEKASLQGRVAGEGWRLRKNGERFWASFVITAIRDPVGRLTGFAKVTRDLSELKRQRDASLVLELALKEERDCLYRAAECSMDALYLCESIRDSNFDIEDFVFTYLNSNVEKMTALSRSSMLGARMCEIFPEHRHNGLFDRYKQVVITGEGYVEELPTERDVPSSPWVRIQAIKLNDGVAITISNVTERKRTEECVLHAAHHDNLTGLPNRSLLRDRIGQAIERAKRFGGKVAVFLVDLDAFKSINDTFGHSSGDGVLVEVAVRLKGSVRATDSVIRIGGDEFVIVMPDITEDCDTLACADKIIDALHTPIEVEGHSLSTTCSLGVAIYPDSGQTIEELLSEADSAMYVAKRGGKNQFRAAVASAQVGQAGNKLETTIHPTSRNSADSLKLVPQSDLRE